MINHLEASRQFNWSIKISLRIVRDIHNTCLIKLFNCNENNYLKDDRKVLDIIPNDHRI